MYNFFILHFIEKFHFIEKYEYYKPNNSENVQSDLPEQQCRAVCFYQRKLQ